MIEQRKIAVRARRPVRNRLREIVPPFPQILIPSSLNLRCGLNQPRQYCADPSPLLPVSRRAHVKISNPHQLPTPPTALASANYAHTSTKYPTFRGSPLPIKKNHRPTFLRRGYANPKSTIEMQTDELLV